MNALRISNLSKQIRGVAELPSSKSLSNRALIISWLSGGKVRTLNLSEADDTRLLNRLLETISIHKGNGQEVTLDCGNAGTVMRFLAALLAVTPGTWLLTGSGRMLERPVGPLVESLKELGAAIDHAGGQGYPPLRIRGGSLEGGTVHIPAGISSQFTSALLMIAPAMKNGINLILEGEVVSRPYIDMTIGLMRQAGISISEKGNELQVGPQDYSVTKIEIEKDWSAAAFWYEAMALARKGDLLLSGLSKESLQGDALLPEIFSHLGVGTLFGPEGARLTRKGKPVSRFTYDFTDHPDLAQAVITTCAGLGVEGHFTGLASLRIKETDRLEALQAELAKTGTGITLEGDSKVHVKAGDQPPVKAEFNTWNDHRMAMALAPLGMVMEEVVIGDPGVVVKSYPSFWTELKKAGFKIDDA